MNFKVRNGTEQLQFSRSISASNRNEAGQESPIPDDGPEVVPPPLP